jgi:hypothetical protein
MNTTTAQQLGFFRYFFDSTTGAAEYVYVGAMAMFFTTNSFHGWLSKRYSLYGYPTGIVAFARNFAIRSWLISRRSVL